MNTLHQFIAMICGTFDNRQQYVQEERRGNIIHPFAKRWIRVCHHQMVNLEESFRGFFVLEDNEYITEEKTTSFQHLFLFDINDEGKIRLTSYEVPAPAERDEEGRFDYKKLTLSKKFTPLVYEEDEGEFWGESVSFFSPVIKFTLWMRVTPTRLAVNEIFENQGQRIIGYDEPIVYDKIAP